MTRELFIETIEALEKQYRYDKKKASQLEAYTDGWTGAYNNYPVIGQLIKLIRVSLNLPYEFNDPHGITDDIDYFIDDLEFGKKWKPGMVTENGNDIKLQTPEDLWNILTKKESE